VGGAAISEPAGDICALLDDLEVLVGWGLLRWSTSSRGELRVALAVSSQREPASAQYGSSLADRLRALHGAGEEDLYP
jgi:hypothetical protein